MQFSYISHIILHFPHSSEVRWICSYYPRPDSFSPAMDADSPEPFAQRSIDNPSSFWRLMRSSPRLDLCQLAAWASPVSRPSHQFACDNNPLCGQSRRFLKIQKVSLARECFSNEGEAQLSRAGRGVPRPAKALEGLGIPWAPLSENPGSFTGQRVLLKC